MGADPGSEATTRVRRLVRAHGRVQGVFYRDSTRREAERVGAAGWVRNLPDGTVEASLEGSAEQVEAMVAFCRSGPPRAQVTRLDVQTAEPEGLEGFEVR